MENEKTNRIRSYLAPFHWIRIMENLIRSLDFCETDEERKYVLDKIEKWKKERL